MNPRDDEYADTAPNNRDSAGSPTSSTFGRPATEDSEGYQTDAGLQGTFQGPRGEGVADDVDPGAAGAEETGGFTTVLALAANQDEYRNRVEAFFAGLGVEVEEFEDVEPLSERLRAAGTLEDEIFELAATLTDSAPVLHSSANHSYDSTDARHGRR